MQPPIYVDRRMPKSSDELMAMRFGGSTVAENIERAVAAGRLIRHDDGTLALAGKRKGSLDWLIVPNAAPLGCEFWMRFLFDNVYAKSAVPHGCGECYKVKAAPRTLRELVAAWQIAKRIACRSKWGLDFYNPHSQNIYAGYFYTRGLDAARALYKVVDEKFCADPKLGGDVRLTIKRGCSQYEAVLGPSDRYQFTPEMAELETYLKSRYRERERPDLLNVQLAHWIDFAFRIGDDTYLDFTGGKRLRPATMTYAP